MRRAPHPRTPASPLERQTVRWHLGVMLHPAHDTTYIDTDIPEGMTIAEWRRSRVTAAKGRHAGRLERLRRRATGLTRPAPALRPRMA